MKIIQHDPVVVSQADPELRNWGPWQFPAIQRLPDGRLAVGYHVEADSATAYGKPPGLSICADEGQTWQPAGSEEIAVSSSAKIFALRNGDLFRQVPLRSVDPATVEDRLPPSVGTSFGGYRNEIIGFDATQMPPDLEGYRFSRLSAGGNEWVEETATVHISGRLRMIYMGVLTFPWMHRITQAPDGALWGVIYSKRLIGGEIARYFEAILLRSVDGRSWEMQSSIPYQPDAAADPHAEERDGFTEPNIAFLPDGSMLCLLRTTDANGMGPMYVCHSSDRAQTWSTPMLFDDCGVWPALVTLGNGVTLAAYGRPGLYLRATRDPSGRVWGDRDTVVAPVASQQDTCSYSDLIALSDHEVLLAYSDFNHPDAEGRPCKTILVRKLTVE
ncbi:MAG: exo-alpha-sialidase [Gemmatimonadetes bacterium]|nr:exo-alpha-sialidase [Gemmatimonadota bacterium]